MLLLVLWMDHTEHAILIGKQTFRNKWQRNTFDYIIVFRKEVPMFYNKKVNKYFYIELVNLQ